MDTEALTESDIPALLASYITNDEDIVDINQDALIAMIPGKFGFDDKVTYLGYRAMGFNSIQAINAVNHTMVDLMRWYKLDPLFAEFEVRYLPQLQEVAGKRLVELLSMRNMSVYYLQDWKLLQSVVNEPDAINTMSPREFKLYLDRRKYYDTNALLNLNKIAEPEKHRETSIKLQINNGPMYEVIDSSEFRAGNVEIEEQVS